MKEANMKRLPSILFQQDDILEKQNYVDSNVSDCQRLGVGRND